MDRWWRSSASPGSASLGSPGSSLSLIARSTGSCLTAASVSYGKATPYPPVIELLKSYFQIGDHDSQRESREKVTGKLLTLDEALKPTSRHSSHC